MPAPHHSVFFTNSMQPTNSVKALKAKESDIKKRKLLNRKLSIFVHIYYNAFQFRTRLFCTELRE